MNITTPDELTFHNVIEFCEYLDSIEEQDEFVFDFSWLGTVEPFGMLLMGGKIRQFMKKYPNARFTNKNFENNYYAANMGFFKSFYEDYGETLSGSNTYRPITKIEVSKLYKDSMGNQEHIVDTIERESERLSVVLSNGNSNLKKTLTYSIREIIRNTVEHSESDYVWFAAQYWPTKNRVEVAILDEGIGIEKTLRTNQRLIIESLEDALLLALEPGVSKMKSAFHDEEDPYANSGFGLFMTSRICKNGGDFVVCTGNKILALNERGNYFFDTSFKGTVIRMRLTVSRLEDLESLIPSLIREGEKMANKNKKERVLSASKVSSLLVTKNK